MLIRSLGGIFLKHELLQVKRHKCALKMCLKDENRYLKPSLLFYHLKMKGEVGFFLLNPDQLFFHY